MLQKKRILICPLDWGLGHATRCIPIIQLLLEKNAEVWIAGSGRSLALLKKEFPQLKFMDLPSYNIQYSDGSLAMKLFLLTPKIFNTIQKEHFELERIIRDKKIDLVISDNRFGLWSKQVKTVFMTHQLRIKTPIGERLLYRINHYYIKKFSECWIPDNAGTDNLSGDLSHPYPMPANAFFVGPLSRFNIIKKTAAAPAFTWRKKYDVLVIISGPEPQRSIFENMILQQAANIPLNFLIVRGITEVTPILETNNNLDIVSHLVAADMREAMMVSSVIVSRSGYSTIMDLAVLKKKAIFIPTPGQTEQEYLAQRCMQKKMAYSEKQAGFDLKRALTAVAFYNGFETVQQLQTTELEKRLTLLLGLTADVILNLTNS